MSESVLPVPVGSKEELASLLPRVEDRTDDAWDALVEDVWLGMEELYRLYGYEGVMVVQQQATGYSADVGLLASNEEFTMSDLNIRMVGPQGNPDEEMDVPPLPLLQQVYTIESTVEDGTNPQYLSGEGAVQVTSVQQQALIIEPDALVFTLAPDANLSPTHITSFRVQVTEENSPMIPDLGESPHQVPRMLRARLFSNEFPGRTHLTAYISPGDIVQMAVEDDAHEKLTETLETAGKRYITPDPPRSGQTFHPCRVTETGPNNVVVQPFGTEETQTFDRVMLINWLMDGDLLPAPRSEQSFSEPALHRV